MQNDDYIGSDYDDGDDLSPGSSSGREPSADKRAHHNALERKRRDHIKESFDSLRDSVPAIHGEKASRAQILKKATDYIVVMQARNRKHTEEIEETRRQNKLLEQQILALERARRANVDGQQIVEYMSLSGQSAGSEAAVGQPGDTTAGAQRARRRKP